MTREKLIQITQRLGVPASHGNAEALGRFFDQYPRGVFIAYGGGMATPGWENYAVFIGKEDELAVLRRLERLLKEAGDVERMEVSRVAGHYVLTFRAPMTADGSGLWFGKKKTIDPTWLNFTMPEGGVVTLNKVGSPTAVELEYSLDNGKTWQIWEEEGTARTCALNPGQTMHVRNTSETNTRFSTSNSNYYNFAFNATTYAGGNIMSLLCSNPANASLTTYGFLLMFYGCTSLVTAPELPATTLASYCYQYMFYGCRNLVTVTTRMTDISATDCLTYWLYNVSPTGDLYCDPSLDLPIGTSGIPSGWTRHDIAEWQGE